MRLIITNINQIMSLAQGGHYHHRAPTSQIWSTISDDSCSLFNPKILPKHGLEYFHIEDVLQTKFKTSYIQSIPNWRPANIFFLLSPRRHVSLNNTQSSYRQLRS